MAQKRGVMAEHPAFRRALPLMTAVRDAYDGPSAVKQRTGSPFPPISIPGIPDSGFVAFSPMQSWHNKPGSRYLPPVVSDDDSNFAAYLLRAPFMPLMGRVVEALTGLVFRKEPELTGSVSGNFQNFISSADGLGNDLEVVASDMVREALIPGRQALSLNMRDGMPVWEIHRGDDVISWYAPAGRLSRVVVRRRVVIPDEKDEFVLTEAYHYRAWTLVGEGVRVRDYNASGELVNNQTVGFPGQDWLPVIIVNHDSVNVDPSKPPLLDLANSIYDHYRLAADLVQQIHWGAMPSIVVAGGKENEDDTPQDFSVGGVNQMRPGTDVKMLESSGNGLNVVRSAVDDAYQKTLVLGARIIASQSDVPETATAARIRTAGDTAILANICRTVDKAITQALRWSAEWMRESLPEDLRYTLNRDFIDSRIGPQDAQILVEMVEKGLLTVEQLYQILKDGEWLRAGAKPPVTGLQPETNPGGSSPPQPDSGGVGSEPGGNTE